MIALSKIQKLVSEHGDCESQSSDLWDGDITLPDEIENTIESSFSINEWSWKKTNSKKSAKSNKTC